jgi:hypothetical protein
MIILYAFETGMPARYEWKNYPECFSILNNSFLDQGNNL